MRGEGGMGKQFTAADLLSDPQIVAGMRRAYQDSEVGGDTPVEQGGFLLYDSIADRLDVGRLPAGHQDSMSFPICSDGTYSGKLIVGSFHTHPNVGPQWRQEPSPQDIRLSIDYPETMGPHQFVISHDMIFRIDNDGTVVEMGSTIQLLQLPREETT
jgi:hypothetical protein